LVEKLQSGEDAVSDVKDFVLATDRPNSLLLATLGNRDAGASPCLKSLQVLLSARANPSTTDTFGGSPAIHVAAWHSSPEAVRLLLQHKADLEAGEGGQAIPPLNTALAAGNAPVAFTLLKQRANTQWRHDDGATPLHVALAWITDPERAGRRLPPLGTDPRDLLLEILHNGCDPSHREGMSGLTPLAAFRSSMHGSPWLRDERVADEFQKTLDMVHVVLGAADEAMIHKTKGNQAWSKDKHDEAAKAWGAARNSLAKGGITGHHVAALWSNEALRCKRQKEYKAGVQACENGLQHWSTKSVRTKLEANLVECKQALAESTAAPTEEEGAKANSTAAAEDADSRPVSETVKADASVQPSTGSSESTEKRRVKKSAGAPDLKQGFLMKPEVMKEPLYGPEGSVQGKNLSELVEAPVMGTRVKVPFRKVMPVEVPRESDEKSDSD